MASENELFATTRLRKEVPDKLRTYSEGTLKALLETTTVGDDTAYRGAMGATGSSGRGSSPTRSGLRRAALGSAGLRQERLMQRMAAKVAAERERQAAALEVHRKARQEAREQDRLAMEAELEELVADMAPVVGVPSTFDDLLAHTDKARRVKQQELYQEWSTEVFDKIQGRLQGRVAALDDGAMAARLTRNMDDYLKTTNAKAGGVFLDTIIEVDYDPLDPARKASIKIPTGDVRDPLKRELIKKAEEDSQMGVPPKVLSPRYMLDVRQWGDGKIQATPYGHCVDATGDYIVRPANEKDRALKASHIPCFDHYNIPVGREYVDAEYPGGKHASGAAAGVQGSRNLFELLHMRAHENPDNTGGDLWLEAKGKARVDGPEQRRGRKGLFDLMQQKPVSPSTAPTAIGDMWLEPKGKQRVDGPEQRRGRKGLFDLMQQKPVSPSTAPTAIGDMWLEAKGKRPLKPDFMNQPPGDTWIEPLDRGKRILPVPPPSTDWWLTMRGKGAVRGERHDVEWWPRGGGSAGAGPRVASGSSS